MGSGTPRPHEQLLSDVQLGVHGTDVRLILHLDQPATQFLVDQFPSP